MSYRTGPKIVTDGLVLCLDAADRNGYSVNSELVTNSNLLVQGDGNSLPCITNSSGNTQLNIGPIVSGKTYQLLWNVTNITGNVSASLRVGFAIISQSTNANKIGFRKHVFTSNLTGTLNFTGNNVGCNFDVDFASLREYNPTLVDLTGNNNNGTLTDGVAFHSPNNGYFIFDGTNDLITTPYIFPTGNLPKSFSVWFKINSTTDRGWIVAGGSDVNGKAFGLFRSGGDKLLYFHGNAAAFDMIFNVSQNTTDWYNATVSYDGTTIRGYINGQLDVEKTVALNTSSSTVDFGARKNRNAADYFNGNIAQASIYNRALTASEIQQNYQATKGRFGL
jgi:hypothetical protein